MKTIDKTVDLSQTRMILENYAKEIVKILEEKWGASLEKDDSFYWQIYINKKDYPFINVHVFDIVDNNNPFSVVLYVKIHFPSVCYSEKVKSKLESTIRKGVENKINKKYPLTNIHFLVSKENSKIPCLEPAEKVAEQLYLATTCYNKIICPETISRIKTTEERIDKMIKKEVDRLVKQF